mmetsp:Transcript_27792/g.24588  ORF Transcript_27792/g.24588 Transcript_27792/m.24588 type:complete len:91 (+) Transcript_27792:369-641(+)
MSVLPQHMEMNLSMYSMGEGVDNSDSASNFDRQSVTQRNDNYRSQFFEPAAMVEPPRKRLVCQYEECNKAFTDISALKKHQNTHGEKNFV